MGAQKAPSKEASLETSMISMMEAALLLDTINLNITTTTALIIKNRNV